MSALDALIAIEFVFLGLFALVLLAATGIALFLLYAMAIIGSREPSQRPREKEGNSHD